MAHCLASKEVVQRRHNRQPHRSPSRPDDLRVLEPNTDIPEQMPYAVVAVVEERECEESLDATLDNHGPRCDSCNHRLRLHVPPSVRGREVCEAEEVERAGQNDGRQAVEAGSVPCDLGLVDGEMRGDGAVEALLCENFRGLGFGGRESASVMSIQYMSIVAAVCPTSAAPCSAQAASLWQARPPVADRAETFALTP